MQLTHVTLNLLVVTSKQKGKTHFIDVFNPIYPKYYRFNMQWIQNIEILYIPSFVLSSKPEYILHLLYTLVWTNFPKTMCRSTVTGG